ncbi:MAG: hypothetical protein AB1505_10005 [Candidatus Latescibacterota bacterium]
MGPGQSLTALQRLEFVRQGYLAVRGRLSEAALADLLGALEAEGALCGEAARPPVPLPTAGQPDPP